MKFINIVKIFAIFAHTSTAVNSKRLDVLDTIQVENDSHEKRNIDAGEIIQTVELKVTFTDLLAPIVLRFGWSQANLKFGIGSGEFQLSVTPAGDQYMEVQGIGNDDIPGAEYLNIDIAQMTAVLEYEKGTGKLLSFDPDSGPNKSVEVTDSAEGTIDWVTPTITILDELPRPPG